MFSKVFRKYRSRRSSPPRHPADYDSPLVQTSHPADRIQQFRSDTTPSSGLSAEAHRVDLSISVQDDVLDIHSPPRGVEQRPGWKTAANSGKFLLGIAKESADVFTPLKSVLGGLTELLKNINQTNANQESIKDIMLRLQNLLTSLTAPFEGGTRYAEKEVKRRETLKIIFDTANTTLVLVSQQNAVVAFLNNQDDAQNITSLVEDIKDAIIDYQASLQQDIFEINCKHIVQDDLNLLEKLPRVKDAGFWSGNRTPCLKGTRVELLQEIENWSARIDPGALPIYWLNGIPGTGKTTIAHTFAQVALAEGRLGGCFFCSRSSVDRSNIHLIFPTIAFQLAYKIPEFRATIVETIRSQSDVGYQSLSDQLTKLVIDPLRSIAPSSNPATSPIVIVLDALDECSDSKSVSAVLSLLSHHMTSIPSVKIFITSRPESHIRNIFRSPLQHFTREIVLQDIDRTTVDRDIEKYMRSSLCELATETRDRKVTLPWPDENDVTALVQRSGGLFIHASTSFKFIASRYHYPPARLQLLLSIPHSSVYEGKLGIDPLYGGIFVYVYKDADTEDAELFSELRLVMSCVVLAFNPMSRASLETLLCMESGSVLTILDPLHSVLRVPDGEESSQHITVFHKSFPDYLTDPIRCKDTRFYVDSSFYHGEIAVRCFELMKTQLKKNICDLPRFAMNADIGDLARRRQERVADALDYACRYVGKHLRLASGAGDAVGRILKLMEDFMRHRLLPWLEILSIGDDLRSAIHSLRDLRAWVLSIDYSHSDLLDLLEDCERFVLYSFDAVEQSASHIYGSPLQWIPATSPVGVLYQDQASTDVKVVSDSVFWDACTRTTAMTDVPFSIAISHKGDLTAGGGGWNFSVGILQIFEAATGTSVAMLNVHDEVVHSIEYSYDDTLLVSGSDHRNVRIWDVQTGGLISVFRGHTNEVNSVAFSPSGTMVISGSDDETIRIWDLSLGCCQRTLAGHAGRVTSVCWSQTQTCNEVISASVDGTVKIWDVVTGDCRMTLHGHTGAVHSIASSLDGSKFASGSVDNTVIICDAQTGSVLRRISADGVVRSLSFSSHGDMVVYAAGKSVFVWDLAKEMHVSTFACQSIVHSVKFSPDGTSITSGSHDGLVRAWQMDTRNRPDAESYHHSGVVTCVSFATDGQLIVSGSADGTAKVWDAATGSCLCTFIGHTGTIYSVAISPNSHLVASGSYDKTVRMWNVRTGNLIHVLEGHESCVIAAQFSPDCDRIVSQSLNGSVMLWDTDRGERLAVLPGGIYVERLISEVDVDRYYIKAFGQAFGEAFGRTIVESSPQSLCDIGGNAVIQAFSDALGEAMGSDFSDIMAEVVNETLEETISEHVHKPIGFFANGTGVILESKDGAVIRSWSITINPDQSSNNNALPLILVPTLHHENNPKSLNSPLQKYHYSQGGEWVLGQGGRHVCWVPADRRGHVDAFHGDKLVLGARNGKVSLLDFSGLTSGG